MRCKHEGFHTITSSYDRRRRVLTCFRRCDDCGARLAEVDQFAYEPRYVARPVEPWVGDPDLGTTPPNLTRAVTTIERISEDAGVRDPGDRS